MNLYTWNMQGSTGAGESKWNTDVKRLFLAGADLVLLQEAGTPPASAPPVWSPFPFATPMNPGGGGFNWAYCAWNMGTASRPNNVGIYWVQADIGGNRCNLAIAFKLTILPSALLFLPNTIVAPPGANPNRPAIGLRFPLAAGGHLDLWTIHAFSGGGGDAPGFCNAVRNFAAGGAWFVGGDFNRDPATMPAVAGGVLCGHAAVATHPGTGTNLDYAMKNAPGALVGNVHTNFVVSDHFPVSYQL